MASREDRPLRDALLERGPGLRTLQAMVDTLLDGAPPELAVELREELPDPLKAATRPYDAEAPETVEDLLERFRERAHLDGENIMHEAQIAVGVVGDMLTADTLGDLRGSLPAEFGVLFERTA